MGGIETHALVLKVCVMSVTLGIIGMFPVGIAMVAIAAKYGLQWPISSCSGIWTPLALLGYVILGQVCIWKYDFVGAPTTPKKWVVSFYMSQWYTFAMVIQHLIWSFLGLGYCVAETANACKYGDKTNILVLESLACFFSLLTTAAMPCAIYLGTGGRLTELSALIVTRTGCCSYITTPVHDDTKTDYEATRQ